jgi:hypothetical protein
VDPGKNPWKSLGSAGALKTQFRGRSGGSEHKG